MPRRRKVSFQDVVAVAQSNPRHVQTNCVYFNRAGKPSCIIGHALAAKGYTAEEIDESKVPTLVPEIFYLRDIVKIQKVQHNADIRMTWEEAVNNV